MKKKDLQLSRIISIIISILIIICSCLPWLTYDGMEYTAFSFLKSAISAGGIVKFIPDGQNIYVGYLFLYLVPITALLYGIYALLLFFYKKTRAIKTLMHWSEALYMLGLSGFQGYSIKASILITGALVALEFVSSIFWDQRQEIIYTYLETKKKEREQKQERKRRLYFPGKYTSDFYRIIRCNLWNNRRNYILFLISGTISSVFLTVILGTNQLLRNVHSKNLFFSGKGLQQIMLGAVSVIILLAVFLVSYVFSYYLKSRIPDYQAFVIFGMRQKALAGIMAVEYVGSLIFALIAGLIGGTFFLLFIRRLLEGRIVGENTAELSFNGAIYVQSIGVYLLVVAIAFAANYDSYERIRASLSVSKSVRHEKIPCTVPLLFVILGAILIQKSIGAFGKQSNHESSVLIFLMATGFYWVLVRGKAFFMNRLSKHDKYKYRHLFEGTPFSYRFKKSMRTIFMLAIINILFIGIFLFRFISIQIAPKGDTVVPYDFVYLAHEQDKSALNDIEKATKASVEVYPMLRITSGGSNIYGGISTFMHYTPNGQNIGISETTYRRLKAKRLKKESWPLDLKGQQIHIVYQQDGSYPSNPVDITSSLEDLQILKIGTPRGAAYEVEKGFAFTGYPVKSKEFSILTGMFEKGLEENIIVFSDAFFDKAYEQMELNNTDGPTKLWVAYAQEDKKEEIQKELEAVARLYPKDRQYDATKPLYYEKGQQIRDVLSERYIRQIIYASVLIMLAACGAFILYICLTFSKSELMHRYIWLTYMGMRKTDRRRRVWRELLPFSYVPIIAGGICAGLLILATFKVRGYSGMQIQSFLQIWIPCTLGYYMLQVLFICIEIKKINREVVKKIEAEAYRC